MSSLQSALFAQKDERPVLAEDTSHRTLRALLVEDDRTLRRLVRANLEGMCQVIEAPDAGRALTSYKACQPDIVFMDIELPDGDGHDVMKRILRRDPGAFIVMFSGHSDTSHVMRAVDSGARGFIAKPFDLNKMFHFIKMCAKPH